MLYCSLQRSTFTFILNPGVKALISAIDGSLESVEMNDKDAQEAALDALGQIGSSK